MKLAEIAINKSTVTYFASALVLIGGLISYLSLGQLEDPEFSIKNAVIVTAYPGASPTEVEEEVTDVIETALQEMGEIKFIESDSRAGLSIVKVEVYPQYWADDLPQIWDKLRRKIRDVEGTLPAGAGRPIIDDEFGDVYGFLFALTGEGYSDKELEDFAEMMKKRLLLVPGVARIEFWGEQNEVIYVDYNRSNLDTLGISEFDIMRTLAGQNMVVNAGSMDIGMQRMRIHPTGDFQSAKDISELVIRPTLTTASNASEVIRLKDIGEVRRGYEEPAMARMRFNGSPAIGLAITNQAGTNIVDLGKRIDAKLEELEASLPIGMKVEKIHWQSDIVSVAVDGFLESFAQSVLIVLVVLTLSMGWRMSIIIGTALVVTVASTFGLMALFGIDLQRMSLGALIISLGMMGDNAIVIADGTHARIAKGMDRRRAAIEAATFPAWPLLGATVVAVMAFYPIYASTDSAGEYCASLFSVVAISLLTSWLISVTLTPLQCLHMLPAPKAGEEENDAYGKGIYLTFRNMLVKAVRFRFLTIGVMVALLISSAVAFTQVKQLFFPDSSMEKFMIDLWAMEGARIEDHEQVLRNAEALLLKDERVKDVATFIGKGPPRFYLPVEPEMPCSAYGQLIVNVEDFKQIKGLIDDIKDEIASQTPEALAIYRPYGVGPANTHKFELRISGPGDADPDTLRALSEQVRAVLSQSPLAAYSTTDWRQRTPVITPIFDQERARYADVTRQDVASAIKRAFDGNLVGMYRENDDTIPIVLRNENAERLAFEGLDLLQVRSPFGREALSLMQVSDGMELRWEDPHIWRRNRLRTITVQANPIPGATLPTLLAEVKEPIEAMSLPHGYFMEWGGEFESSRDAQLSLLPGAIPALAVIVLSVVMLFNAYRPSLTILMTVPFAFVGVSYGLLFSGTAFGFVALLGAMSLSGMMIKNAVVLIDEINLLKEQGQSPYNATINATLSRLRPVFLASATTVLGVVPLLQDVFWVGLAAAIMAGLTFGTLLTLILVPVFYATLYNIKAATVLVC